MHKENEQQNAAQRPEVLIKLCGLKREADVLAANEIRPAYVGFVFAKKSRRAVDPETARRLKQLLDPSIQAVGVFVDEAPEAVAALLEEGIIDLAQLHGHEDEAYIRSLRGLSKKPLIRAFRIESEADIRLAEESSADYILLDSGAGDGKVFDWSYLAKVTRPYFLAGGLTCENAAEAVRRLAPYAVDVSSGIETDGVKDPRKMRCFADTVRTAI